MRILNKHHYISCESGVWLKSFSRFNQQVTFCLWIMVLFFLLGYESKFYYITILDVKCETSNDKCPFLVICIWGRKEREEVKMKNKTRLWYITCSILQWIVFMWAASGKCGKQNWWLYNDFRGKRACFELTTVLTAWMLKLEMSCQKYCLTLQNRTGALHSRKERWMPPLCVTTAAVQSHWKWLVINLWALHSHQHTMCSHCPFRIPEGAGFFRPSHWNMLAPQWQGNQMASFKKRI